MPKRKVNITIRAINLFVSGYNIILFISYIQTLNESQIQKSLTETSRRYGSIGYTRAMVKDGKEIYQRRNDEIS